MMLRTRCVCFLMVALTLLLGLESAALAYPSSPEMVLPEIVETGRIPTPGVTAAPAHLVRGPHLMARQARRYGIAQTGPAPLPPMTQRITDQDQHLVSGTALTVVSAVLLGNFLWMVIVGAVWFFGFYLPEASSSVAFPPQAALFFVSFAFLVPGLILLPKGLKELKTYRAMQTAERVPDGPDIYLGRSAASMSIRSGGVPLLRF